MSWKPAFLALCVVAMLFGAPVVADPIEPDELSFAPETAVEAILEICASQDFSGSQTAIAMGLQKGKVQKSMAWVLSADAEVWELQSRDGQVLLFAYGPQQSRCGVIINFTIPFAGRYAVSKELADIGNYHVFSESEISTDVHFIRMFNEQNGRYIDIVDYPGSRSSPGLIKVELLAE